MIFKSLTLILSIISVSGCIQLQIKTNRAELGTPETPVLEETSVVAQEAQVVITPEVIEPPKVSEITVTKSSLSQDLKIVKNSSEIIKLKVDYDDVLWVRICPMSLSQISLNYDGVKFKEVILEHQKFFSARLMDDGRSVAFSSMLNLTEGTYADSTMRLVKDNGGTYLVHLLAVPCTNEQLGVSQKQFELQLTELSEMQKKQPIKSMAEIEEEKKKSLAQAEFNQNFPDRAKLIQSVELGMCKVKDISSCELETESSYNCIYSYLPDISSDTTWSSRKDKLAKEESNFRLNKNVCLTKKENCQRGSIFKPVPMNQIIQVLGDHGFSQYIKKMKMILEGKNPAESCRENL